MKLSLPRAMTIARREYLTTVRRKAFLFTLIFFPAYLAFVSVLPGLMVGDSLKKRMAEMKVVALVDSSGALAAAPAQMVSEVSSDRSLLGSSPKEQEKAPERYTARIERYADFASADADLRAGKVGAILVAPPDYLATGTFRRYVRDGGLFGGSSQNRSLRTWLSRAMVAGSADSLKAERAAQPTALLQEFSLDGDRWELRDDSRRGLDILLPIGLAMLLGMSIVIGGQYLLQGVTEEKESRILESLLCTVSPQDLMIGKLVGLGAAGMTLVLAWVMAGMFFGGPVAALVGARFTPILVVCAVLYFLLGYLFYASLMTAIGAIAGNLREAQQIAYLFTIANFVPMFVWVSTIDQPNSTVPRVLSMIPLTAPTTMMMRLSTGTAIPFWEIALSLALLVIAAGLAVFLGSRIFRTGLLMYGKTPNLPEILRWARQA